MPFKMNTMCMVLPDFLPPKKGAPEMIKVWEVHSPPEPFPLACCTHPASLP